MSLKQKTISGMFWSLLQNVGGRGISFIVMIVLARLLTPEIFGLIGMLMIFIQVSQTLVEAGFNQALIQKKDTDEEDYSSVFWINLVVSILIYAILFVGAPWIATFYEKPVLIELTRALSLVFVINAFSYVQEARLSKEMHFKTLTLVNLPSTIIGGIVAIVMAVMGFGVWSIIALQLVTRFAYALQIWIYAKWKPLFTFNKQKTKKLFAFGGNLMATGILISIYNNIYLVVIGKFFPLSAVGYYHNAFNLIHVPATTISGALSKVAFPAFSTIQHDDKKLKESSKKIIQQLTFWSCPAFVLAAILAEPLFHFVFGVKWLPAVPYFQILCVFGILYPLNLFNLNVVNIKGRSDLTLKLTFLKKGITTLGIIVAIPLGIWYLLIFRVIDVLIAYFLNAYFAGRFIQYSMFHQIKDVLPVFLLTAIVGIGVFFMDQSIEELPNTLRIMIGFGLGGGLYLIIAKFNKLSPYLEFIQIAKGLRQKAQSN